MGDEKVRGGLAGTANVGGYGQTLNNVEIARRQQALAVDGIQAKLGVAFVNLHSSLVDIMLDMATYFHSTSTAEKRELSRRLFRKRCIFRENFDKINSLLDGPG